MKYATPIGVGIALAGLTGMAMWDFFHGDWQWYGQSTPERLRLLQDQRATFAKGAGLTLALATAGYLFGGKQSDTIGRGIMYGSGAALALLVIDQIMAEQRYRNGT